MPSEPQTESAIEIRVDDIAQLFDTLDPFPFRERDLDKDAEEFIVGWGQEFPRHSALKIIIHDDMIVLFRHVHLHGSAVEAADDGFVALGPTGAKALF